MPTPLSPDDLQAYLAEHRLEAEVIRLAAHTPTVETAAEVVRVHPDQIVKSLLFLIGQSDRPALPVLVIASGTGRVDRRLLAAHFGISRRKTHLADADTVLALTGFPVGAVPPLGHRQPLKVLVDPAVLVHREVYGGGGSNRALLRLDPRLILAHNQAEVVPLQTEAQE
jgi:prolyl-tRNA editing enzyme YbaK/EbsC (Cys-tRNA(Pro) deacylase)